MAIKDKILNKQLLKKWWFWVIVVVIGLISIASGNTKHTDTANNESHKSQTVTYTITGETLGKYGKQITLGKDTDNPTTEYLYKLPAGTYKVTTTFEKLAAFSVVKDKTTFDVGGSHEEVFDYVGQGQYQLTAGDNDFNGHAKKEVVVTIGNDESINTVGTDTFIFEKQ